MTKVLSEPPNTTIKCKRSHKRNSINQCLKQPYMHYTPIFKIQDRQREREREREREVSYGEAK